jgi:IS1 family transposase/transposase-like protein
VKCRCCDGESRKFGRFQNQNRIVQRFQCLLCGTTFSESQPLDGLRLDHDKAVQIVKLLTEGIGIRACARLTDCHIHTVLEVLRVTGEKCARLLDERIRGLTVPACQIDELWSRVAIRQSRTTARDKERGDFYTFLALDARTKLIISHYTGKRDAVSTDFFVADLAERIVGRIQITTDSWNAYPDTIQRYLIDRLDYAVMVKQYAATPGQIEAKRRYSPAPFIGVKIRIKAGAPRRDWICTSHVERQNLTVRHFNKRFARLGLGWSRKLENHRHSIALFVAAYNFCKVHSTLGCTPAVGAKITDHAWTIEELLEKL